MESNGRDGIGEVETRIIEKYEERLHQQVQMLSTQLIYDKELILQMAKDEASMEHIPARIQEIVAEAFKSEQEKKIRNMTVELSQLQTHCRKYTGENSKLKSKNSSYQRRIEQLESQLKQTGQSMEVVYGNQIKESQKEKKDIEIELQKTKEEVTRFQVDNEALVKRNRELQEGFNNLQKDYTQSENDRLKVKEMFEDVKQKIESLVQSESGSMIDLGPQESVFALRTKISDLKKKLSKESKSKLGYKKLMKEMNNDLEEKNRDAKETLRIVQKLESKVEKYKKSHLQIQRKMDELQDELHREKNFHSKLKREVQDEVDSRVEKTERMLKNSYETRITELTRQLNEKELKIQNFYLENKQRKPDEVDNIVRMYQSKINQYESEYISKPQHTLLMKDQEQRHMDALRQLQERLESEYKGKMEDIQSTKSKDFSQAVGSIQEAMKALERNLDKEKESTQLIQEKLEEQQRKNEKLLLSLKEQEDKNKWLHENLQSAQNDLEYHKSLINHERKSGDEVRMENESLLQSTKKQKMQLELISAEKSSVQHALSKELEDLRSANAQLDQVYHEKKDLEYKFNHLVQNISNEIRYVTQKSDEINADNIVPELRGAFMKFRVEIDDRSQQITESKGKLKAMNDRLMVMKQRMIKLQSGIVNIFGKVKSEISAMKRDIHDFKRDGIQKFSEDIRRVIKACHDVDYNVEERFKKQQKRFEETERELTNQTRKLIQQKEEELTGEFTMRLNETENVLRETQRTKSNIEQLQTNYSRKFDDLKILLKHLNTFIPLPMDVQNGILSNDREFVTAAFQQLSELLSERKSNELQTSRLVQDLEDKLQEQSQVIAVEHEANKSLRFQVEELEDLNNSIRTNSEAQALTYEQELNLFKSHIHQLQSKHNEEISTTEIQSKNSMENLKAEYQKRLDDLKGEIQKRTLERNKIKNEKRELAESVYRVRNELDTTLSELTMTKQDIKRLTQENSSLKLSSSMSR